MSRLIAVVGPSGVGKDSVIAGLLVARPDLIRVRRVITRAADLGDEDFEPVSSEAFETKLRNGAFCLHWQAHGLSYGIPEQALSELGERRTFIANLSRSVLRQAARLFPDLIVFNITAKPETLALRLAQRGRETETDIAARLSRTGNPVTAGPNVHNISNDGPLEDTVAAAMAVLSTATCLPENSDSHPNKRPRR